VIQCSKISGTVSQISGTVPQMSDTVSEMSDTVFKDQCHRSVIMSQMSDSVTDE